MNRSGLATRNGSACWLRSIPGKGYFVTLRFYNPLQSFFDKSWRPSETEPV